MFNLYNNLIKNIKKNFFPFYKNKEIKFLFEKLHKDLPSNKVVARFVGGCVRKHLLGEKIDDIDIATTLTSDQIKEKLKNTDFKVIETGLKHGTVTVVSNNYKFELTTLRKDVLTDGRHAKVEFTDDWHLDSERRDFTINAIYLDIKGKIFDPQMGSVDLKNENVKFIGDPQKRIEEDFLRIIRFIRFKIMYQIKVELSTVKAIKQNLDGLKKISKDRILLELLKILDLKNFLKLNENHHLKEIFNIIFPEFLNLDNLERLKKVYNYSEINKDILLAILLFDGKDNHEYFFYKYNVSNKIKNNLTRLAFNLDRLKNDKNFLIRDLAKNIYLNGKDHLIALNLINFTCNSKVKIEDFTKNLNSILNTKVPNFGIDGEYLKQNGMKEGAELGKVLKIIENQWIKNGFKISKDQVSKLIKENSV